MRRKDQNKNWRRNNSGRHRVDNGGGDADVKTENDIDQKYSNVVGGFTKGVPFNEWLKLQFSNDKKEWKGKRIDPNDKDYEKKMFGEQQQPVEDARPTSNEHERKSGGIETSMNDKPHGKRRPRLLEAYNIGKDNVKEEHPMTRVNPKLAVWNLEEAKGGNDKSDFLNEGDEKMKDKVRELVYKCRKGADDEADKIEDDDGWGDTEGFGRRYNTDTERAYS